ncbi:MAG: hypothetical protein O3A53_17460 [Acidobacteria bacterium]|nr:hypothetical protein [Acidobacteriota bacterium]MDA1236576.1 hypothetical protein [Acidobacteriota bacterium]
MAITWLTAFKATAAITWRSLVANVCITLLGIGVSLALGYKVGVSPEGVAGLSFQWTRPFGSYVAIAQSAATVWAVKRSVEVTLLQRRRKLDLIQSISATWSFAWRHCVAVFGVAALFYPAIRHVGERRPQDLEIAVLAFLAAWTFGPSFIWAVRGMLRAQSQSLTRS